MEIITNIGQEIKKRWQQLADLFNIGITQWGLPALSRFSFTSNIYLADKTCITQEMLAKGSLVGNSIYVSTKHKLQILAGYFTELDM